MPARRSKYPPEYYPSAIVCDAWGRIYRPTCARRNGSPLFQLPALDQPGNDEADGRTVSDDDRRHQVLKLLADSAQFTRTELQTLYALVIERCTLAEIARHDGCSRQAVVARIVGNSMGHGGILRKIQQLQCTNGFNVWVSVLPEMG